MPFSGLASSKLNIINKNIRVGYEYIEESFDTIFNMGLGVGRCIMGREIRPWTKDLTERLRAASAFTKYKRH